jgi:isopentenyl-diphosphate delta-isomerase
LEDTKLSSARKKDHINLAFQSVVDQQDQRFNYEPLLGAMPDFPNEMGYQYLGFSMRAPIWVSSMTGGTEKAGTINHRLAEVCGEMGLGMGLGSCRSLLYGRERLDDFDVKDLLGEQPLFANLGIAQLAELIEDKALDRIEELLHLLKADGLIIHINPFQEWMQPEGDVIRRPPIESLEVLRENYKGRLVVKEVGQGMGPDSLRALLSLAPDGIEFGAFGGTNFSKLELLRTQGKSCYTGLVHLGHTAHQMVHLLNQIRKDFSDREIAMLIPGGATGFPEVCYLCSLCQWPSIYGQAGAFLRMALEGPEALKDFVRKEILGYKLAEQFLTLRNESGSDGQ